MATKTSGTGLKKKAGPLPIWGWFGVAAGTYLLYRWYSARQAANAATAASGTTGGTLIPNDIGLPAASSTGAGTFTSMAAWQQAFLTFLTGNGLSPGDALNAVSAYTQGNCVSQSAYNALAAGLSSSSVGLPPGFTAPPTLSVCPSSTTTTAAPSAAETAFEQWLLTPGAVAAYNADTGSNLKLPLSSLQAFTPSDAAFLEWSNTPGAAAYYTAQTGKPLSAATVTPVSPANTAV